MKFKKKKTIQLPLTIAAAERLLDLAQKDALRQMTATTPNLAVDRPLYVQAVRVANEAQMFLSSVVTLIKSGGNIQGVNQ
jgi:hypothetical protein